METIIEETEASNIFPYAVISTEMSDQMLGQVDFAGKQPSIRGRGKWHQLIAMARRVEHGEGSLYLDLNNHYTPSKGWHFLLALYGRSEKEGNDPIFLYSAQLQEPLYLITTMGTSEITPRDVGTIRKDLTAARALAEKDNGSIIPWSLGCKLVAHRADLLSLLSHTLIVNPYWQSVWELFWLPEMYNKLRLIHWNVYTQHNPE